MRRSSATAPECRTNLNALLLIGSIRFVRQAVSSLLHNEECQHQRGESGADEPASWISIQTRSMALTISAF